MIRVKTSKEPRIPAGAMLVAINSHKIEDHLEYKFYNDVTEPRKVVIKTKDVKKTLTFKPHEKIRIQLEKPVYRQCENDCDFCFINGLPKGLRRELYFRDDDYRLSFLFGNFLSLTNISKRDIKKIGRLKLSPLYVSVHTTNPDLRRKLFKNAKAELIMEYLSALVRENITVHCQIVLIPGVTDGGNLIHTITALSTLYPGVSSIGVVPVGKTKYLKAIPAVSKRLAKQTIRLIESLHSVFRKSYGKGLVYLADEFYIKAGLPIPKRPYYDDFAQYENGIGMVRQFIDEIDGLRTIKRTRGRFLLLTSTAAFPYVHMLKMRLSHLWSIDDENIDVVAVENRFFGKSVTVSGLIGAGDFSSTIRSLKKKYDRIILPPNCVNDDRKFIDDQVLHESRVIVAPHSIKELVKCLL